MKIRFYFAQTEQNETRKEYIIRYNMHEGIVTTLTPEAAATFDLADPPRRNAANVFQTMMQIMNPSPNPVQFELVETREFLFKPLDIKPTTTDQQLQDILGLVLTPAVPLEEIAKWTDEQRGYAIDWAGAMHFHASDNDVEVPAAPDFLKPFGAYDIRKSDSAT